MGQLALSLKKPFAFIWRDLIDEASYRFAFVSRFASIGVMTLMLFFLARLLVHSDVPSLDKYGGDYFPFVLVGFAFSHYLTVSLNGISRNIRKAQMLGTLEALLVTQTRISTIIVSSSLYTYLFTSLQVLMFLLVGNLAFGVSFADANATAALVFFVLTILSFGSLGILSASFIIFLKKGNPVNWVLSTFSMLLGGVYYPVSVLPGWLQSVAKLLPITHALEGMRLSLLKGYSLEELLPQALALLVLSVVVTPLSLVAFKFAVRKAKTDGNLTHY